MRNRAARAFSLIVAVALVVTTGCAQLTDIHDRPLTLGLGLDAGPMPGDITVTTQGLHPAAVGQGGGGGGGSPAGGGGGGSVKWTDISASGRTLGAALAHLQQNTDRQLYLGQVAVILFGTSLAKKGTLHDLETVFRAPEVAETVQIAVVQGEASGFLEKGLKEQASQRVATFLRVPHPYQAVLANPLWHFTAQSLALGAATYAPMFAPVKDKEGMKYVGTAIFVHGRMVDELSPQESAALSWLLKRGGLGTVSLGTGADEMTLSLRTAGVIWNLRDATHPHITLHVRGEVVSSPGRSWSDQPATIRKDVSHEMTTELEAVLTKLQADQADLLGVGERLRERGALPPGPWGPHFAQLHFSVSVHLRLVPVKVR